MSLLDSHIISNRKRSEENEKESQIWAEGDKEQVESLGGVRSAKGWAEYVKEIDNINDRIEKLSPETKDVVGGMESDDSLVKFNILQVSEIINSELDFEYPHLLYGPIRDLNNYNNLTILRDSIKRHFNTSGNLSKVGNNIIPLTFNPNLDSNNGWRIEESKQNLLDFPRDMSSSTWVKSTITTSSADGVDGETNNATKIAATSNNSTILQSTTLSLDDRTYSCYIRKINLSGTIEITIDGGTTWSDITNNLSYGFTRVSISANIQDPQVGLRLSNSGDEVVVDLNQLEKGLTRTSPMLDETRNKDSVSSEWDGPNGTYIIEAISGGRDTQSTLFSLDNGTQDNRIYVYRNQNGNIILRIVTNSTEVLNENIGFVSDYKNFSFALSFSNFVVMATVEDDPVSQFNNITLPDITKLKLGSDYGFNNHWNSFIKRFKYYQRI